MWGSAEYGVVTAGIINLAKTAVKEFDTYNITVNAISLGMVGNPINLKLKDKWSPFIETEMEGMQPVVGPIQERLQSCKK